MHLRNGRNQAIGHLRKWVQLRAKVGGVDEKQNGYCTHLRNWAYSVHHPLDSHNSPFPCILSVNRLLSFIGAIESNLSLLGRRRLCPAIRHNLDGKGIRGG